VRAQQAVRAVQPPAREALVGLERRRRAAQLAAAERMAQAQAVEQQAVPRLAMERVPRLAMQRVPRLAVERMPRLAMQRVPRLAVERMPRLAVERMPRLAMERMPRLAMERAGPQLALEPRVGPDVRPPARTAPQLEPEQALRAWPLRTWSPNESRRCASANAADPLPLARLCRHRYRASPQDDPVP